MTRAEFDAAAEKAGGEAQRYLRDGFRAACREIGERNGGMTVQWTGDWHMYVPPAGYTGPTGEVKALLDEEMEAARRLACEAAEHASRLVLEPLGLRFLRIAPATAGTTVTSAPTVHALGCDCGPAQAEAPCPAVAALVRE